VAIDGGKKQNQYLTWDVYPSHRPEEVKATATEVKMHLSFVPSGQTGTWQPLYYRVFGSVKARAEKRFRAAVVAALDSLVMLSNVWSAVPQDEILEAWSCCGLTN